MGKEVCPWCKEEVEVREYGRRVPCPRCGKLVDVFPDTDLWLDTPFGKIGVNLEQVKSILELFLKKGG